MKVYLISYDLDLPELRQDYETLTAYIKSHTYWAKPLHSVWFIKTTKGVAEVRDEIKGIMDSGDKVLVMEVKRTWATFGISEKVTGWMKRNIE